MTAVGVEVEGGVVPMPEVPAWRGVLALPRLRQDALGYFEDMHRRHGPVVRLRMRPHPLVLISEPAWIDEVLYRHAADVSKDEITRSLRSMLGDGLLTSEGDTWRTNRRRIAPSFQRAALDGYVEAMVSSTDDMVGALGRDQIVDAHTPLMGLTLRIVVRCLFGTDAALPADRIAHALDAYMLRFVEELRTWRRLLPQPLLWPGRRAHRAALTTLDGALNTLIAARRARGEEGHDLLGRLLAARDADGSGFTDAELRDELVTLLVAGHETTALALTYACALLARAPDDQRRARREVEDVLGDRAPTAEDLGRLPFLRAVVNETLRLYPPAWATGREVLTPFRIGPYALEVGDQATVMPWIVHRDPSFWPDAHVFAPDRWSDGLEKRLPRCRYFPFGHGPRTCVGNHFAMMELLVVLAGILRSVDLLPGGPLPALLPAVTLRPTGPVPVRFVRRGRKSAAPVPVD